MYRKLQHNFDIIQYLLKNATSTQLGWLDPATGWSLGEIICHLRDVEMWCTRFQVPEIACLARREKVDQKEELVAIDYGAGLVEYSRYRQETVVRLCRLAPVQWFQQIVMNWQIGRHITPVNFVNWLDRHDRIHIGQIEHIIHTMPLNPLLARAMGEIEEYHQRYQPYLVGATSVLDIGVGPGLALRHVMEQNPHLAFAGVDVRDLRLPGVNVPLQLYDGYTLPYTDNQFDVALLFYVLHHCQDPWRLLDEAVRVMRQSLIVIEEFGQPGVDKISLDLTERQSHRALGIPADLPYQLFDEWEFAEMIRARHLRQLEHQALPSQTTRPVQKYLYVLAKDRR